MEFIPLAIMIALLKKVVDFARYVTNRQWNGVVTQLIAWVGGVAIVALVANTAWAGSVGVGDFTLSDLNFASQILAGLALGSSSSILHDALRAVDNKDSQAIPPLLGDASEPTYSPPPVDTTPLA